MVRMLKRYFFVIITIFLFIFMLLFPQPVFNGAKKGLLLWFQTVLPSLLPFLIIVNLLLQTNVIRHISRFLYPIFGPALGIGRNGCFAVLAGFLCGYPMGAKVTADLVELGKITKREGAYLLSFCNNTSPGFVAGFVVCQALGRPDLVLPSLCILVLVPLFLSVPFRLFYQPWKARKVASKAESSSAAFRLEIIDEAIMDGFETITKIGGYIILFSVLLSLALLLPIRHPLWKNGFLPLLEITNGVVMAADSSLPFACRYAFLMGLCAFGGFCAAAQTNCMIAKCGLPLFPYIIEKLAAALAASLAAYCYFTIFCM